MEPINGINRIVESLRRQISKKEKNSRVLGGSSSQTQGSNRTHDYSRISTSQLKSKISERIANIDKNAKNYKQEATNVILESILLWEFGDNFLNDPEFSDMVQEISSTITSDININNKMTDLINNLSDI